MIFLKPSLSEEIEFDADEVACMRQMGLPAIEQVFDTLYDDAEGTFSIASAVGSDGKAYTDMTLRVIGSYKQDGVRYCICNDGFTVDLDSTMALVRELYQKHAA